MDRLRHFLARNLTLTNALKTLVLVKLMLSGFQGWELALCFFFAVCDGAYGRFLDAKNDERLRVLKDEVDVRLQRFQSATAKDLGTLTDAISKINVSLAFKGKLMPHPSDPPPRAF